MSTSDPNATFDGLDGPGDDVAETGIGATARFDVGDEVARGGLGRVHVAHDRTLEREVAVKMLLHSSSAATARFRRETLLTARLQHPNIVPVYDGGHDDDGTPYLAMRLVHGESLQARIEGCADLSERLALLPAVVDVCHAVAYAHSQRVAHRDLKPDNILVGDFGETVVIDWGLAKDLDAVDETTDLGDGFVVTQSHSLTRVGSVVGTPSYMPPEQAAGQPVDERADVYALGAVLYHLIGGTRPYHDADDVLAAVVAGPPTPLHRLDPAVPRDLETIVRSAMAREPRDRYPGAEALAEELERFREGRPVDRHPYTPIERVARFVRAYPLPLALGSVLLVGALLALVVVGRATRAIEAQRHETELARADVAELQQDKRRRLDALTLDRARALVDDEPGRALAELTLLSDDHPFDGEVRTVATAAWSARPARTLDGPVGAVPSVATWHETGPVVAWNHHLVQYDEALVPARTVPLGGTAMAVASLPGGVVACTGSGTVWVPDDAEARDLGTAPCFDLAPLGDGFVALDATGRSVLVGPGGRATVVAPSVAQPRRVGGTAEHLAFWTRDRRLLLSNEGGPLEAIGSETIYEIAGVGDAVVLLGHEPTPLRVLRWSEGLTMASVPMAAEWLDRAAWVDPDHLAVSGSDDAIAVVDLRSDQVVRTIPLRGRPRALARHPGRDARVAVGTDEGMVAIVDTAHGDIVQVRGHGAPVVDLAWSDDHRHLVTVSLDGVEVHSVRGRNGGFLARTDHRIRALIERADGPPLIATDEGLLEPTGRESFDTLYAGPTNAGGPCGGEVWFHVTTGLRSWPSRHILPLGPAGSHDCSPDGRWLAAATQGGVVVFDARTGEEHVRHGLGEPVRVLRFGASGDLLATTARRQLRMPGGVGAPVEIMAVPSAIFVDEWRGRGVFVTSSGTLWVEGQGGPAAHVGRTATSMHTVGDRVAIGDRDGGVLLFEEVDQPLVPLRGHRQYIGSMAAHPSGRWLATGGWDHTAWLWDLEADPIVGRPLVGHRGAITSIKWSADGRTLYTADLEGSVRSWTDPLATDPSILRRQIQAMAEAAREGRPMPSDAELARMAETSPHASSDSDTD